LLAILGRLAAAGLAYLAVVCATMAATPQHGLAIFGDLKYGPDFTHVDYVNPDAPKGGEVRLSAIGTFDSLNPFILKGTPAAGVGGRILDSFLYDSLFSRTSDEAFSSYGLVAESAEVAEDQTWVIFNLRRAARWHDGVALTADDVVFSFNVLKQKGRPFYKLYFANVLKAEALGPYRVKFTFDQAGNRELPMIIAELPILPKHYWATHDFSKTTLTPPLGSGPYRISAVNPGASITFERVADYWAKDVPIKRGLHNFDRIRFDYYRDATVALEAFKAHQYDLRIENTARAWARSYDFPALRAGLVKKVVLPTRDPAGMQGFAFNIRRAIFADPRVREALSYAFDFEWTNKNLFFGQYIRTRSYFENSPLASTGLPSAAERALLEPLRDQIPPRVFTTQYAPPRTDAKGGLRANLRHAKQLLEQTGWQIRDGKLVNRKTGAPMAFEILLVQPAFERVVAPFVRNLKRLGIDATIRIVDTAQYIRRLDSFDFDMIVASWGETLSPGNEQREFWGSAAAERQGSRNLVGIENPAVDTLINKLIYAADRPALITATRALDRVLLWNHYVIPNWYFSGQRVAYWDKFAHPATIAPYEYKLIDVWWVDPQKAARLKTAATP
jgi:microcin C transport system substrate-binding protein